MKADYQPSRICRAREKCMSHIRPSLQRIIKDAGKKMKARLTGFSYIREYDLLSHATKVVDKKTDRRVYICLMLGHDLYLEDFYPDDLDDENFYAIAGLCPEMVVLPSARLKEIFSCISNNNYDVKENRCRIKKADFLAGVRLYAAQKRK